MATTFVGSSSAGDVKVTALISAAHFFSHFYILILPPIFPVLQSSLGVSATELGLAITALNIVTMFCQAPTGILVDRFGPARILIAGQLLFSAAIVGIGLFPSYTTLVLFMLAAGLGNAVYHPADYAILASRVSSGRVGRAFSIHTFGGYAGFAAGPLLVVPLTAALGWQHAVMLLGSFGIAMGLLLVVCRQDLRIPTAPPQRPGGKKGGQGTDRRLLLSGPVLLSLLFFVLLAAGHSGFTTFSPVALSQIYDLELVQANVPLTSYLVISAVGVLLGGAIADRTNRHAVVIAVSSLTIAISAALIAILDLGLVPLIGLFLVAGLASGTIAPSRDMLVRSVTPPGASGRVFGFVMTGLNIGSLVLPPLYGRLIDLHHARSVFGVVAVASLLTLLTVLGTGRDKRGAG